MCPPSCIGLGGPGARHARTPGFHFSPSKTSRLTNHPGEKTISSLKTIKHFEKVKPLPCVQSANNSVQEEAVLGKVRGKREVVRRLERLPRGKLSGAGWEGGGGSPGSHGLIKPAGLIVQDGGHLGLMVTFSPAGLPSLGGGSVNIKGKSMESQQLAQGFLSGWGRQPASTSQGSLMRPKGFDQGSLRLPCTLCGQRSTASFSLGAMATTILRHGLDRGKGDRGLAG